MLDAIDRSTEAELIAGIDRAELERHLDAFEGLSRFPASDGEWTASDYIVETLRGYGLDAEVLEYTGYVSVPASATVTLTTPHREVIDEAITAAFGAATPPAGVHGRLVAVESVAGPATDADLEGAIVLTPGLPRPESVVAAERAGARAVVFGAVTDGPLHEMIVTPIWGTPTPEEVEAIPDLPVAQIGHEAARRLRDAAAAGPVEACVTTAVTTGLRDLPCPVGRLEGTASDRYLVVGNHVDAWYEGLTDNATAMAATLELARLFAARPPARGLVFGFWSAHSFGRFAGSAWYADTHWDDLRENGVAYLHLDLNGLRGADRLWYQHMAELEAEQVDVLESVSDRPVESLPSSDGEAPWEGEDRPGRAADQSFWGTGLSSILCGVRHEAGTPEGGPIGGGWWWHTAEDTRDKVDVDVLIEETELYVALASRICHSPVLPHDFSATVRDIEAALDEIESTAAGEVSFDRARDSLARLDANLVAATAVLEALGGATDGVVPEAEDLQVRLGNLLVPTLYMARPDYEHEPAMPHQLLPGLRPAERLPDLEGRDRRFLETAVTRGRARLRHRLGLANDAVERFNRAHGAG